MTRINLDIVVHRHQVNPDHPPVKQKWRKFAPEHNKVVNEEVQKLLDIGSVREVHYPDWLANVIVVRKKNGKWRVCMTSPTSTRLAQRIHFRSHILTC